MITYKQLCSRCRKNYVIVTWKDRYPVCYECDKLEMSGEISDPKMKKLFNISEEYYKQSKFLRNIKINYFKYGSLTVNQIKAFKDVVKKLKLEASPLNTKKKKA